MNNSMIRLAPVVFVLLWGTGFVGARMGMPYAEPGTFLAVRFALACALLALLSIAMGAKWPDRMVGAQQVLVGFLMHGVYLGGVFWAIDRGMPAGVSAVIVGMQPVLTALLAGLFLGELITRRHWFAMVLGVSGVVLVLWPKFEWTAIGITPVTITVTAIGMMAITVATLLQKRFGSTVDMRTGTSLQYLGGVMPVAALSYFTETQTIQWTGELVFAFVWLTLVLSLGAVFLLVWLLRQDTVARVSALLFLVPAVAALASYFLFGETLTVLQLGGMALCSIAVVLVNSTGKGAVSK